MDEKLGNKKHEFRNKNIESSRNEHSAKALIANCGDVSIHVSSNRKTVENAAVKPNKVTATTKIDNE